MKKDYFIQYTLGGKYMTRCINKYSFESALDFFKENFGYDEIISITFLPKQTVN
jgi:hypothetical protein